MELLPLLQQMAFGLFLGAVVGLERERVYQLYNFKNFAGFRTFSLIGLFGVLSTIIQQYSIVLFGILSTGFVALLVASYISSSVKSGEIGATTEIACLIVFIAGYFVGLNEFTLAAIIVIFTVIVLIGREKFHLLAKKITKEELSSIILFLVIGLIILPLLPNQYFGPWDSLNPYVIWLMVVIISAISLISYLAVKIVGADKGISLSGFLGGLVSSTAVSLSFSQKSRKNKKIVMPFVIGIVIACSAMFFRLLLAVSLINTELVSHVWMPLTAAGGTGILATLIWWKITGGKNKSTANQDPLDKPLDLWGAIKFGGIFAVVLLVTKYASITFGDQGIYITSVVGGLLDTDAITVTMANLAKNSSITLEAAANATIIASISNTLFKGLMVAFLASRRVGLITFGILALIAATGLGTMFLI